MPPETGYEELLTPAECAAIWKVDPKTITRWSKAGKLTAIRTLGGHRRYRKSEVTALLEPVPEPPRDPLKAPVRTLWPSGVTGPAAAARDRLQAARVLAVGDLTRLTARDLREKGLSGAHVDEVRLALFRKRLTLHGEVLGDAA